MRSIQNKRENKDTRQIDLASYPHTSCLQKAGADQVTNKSFVGGQGREGWAGREGWNLKAMEE